MSDRMTTRLVSDALKMAFDRKSVNKSEIIHLDRGSQYCSTECQALLAGYQMIRSMSKAGDCYDNAAMESWNHILKVKAIDGEKLLT
jgi:putative transposase